MPGIRGTDQHFWRPTRALTIAWLVGFPIVSHAANPHQTGGASAPVQNGRLSFQSASSGSSQLAVIDPDGAGLRAVTAPPGSAIDPAWSPDGAKLAISSERDGIRGITVVDFFSGARTAITGVSGAADRHPAWSPDGTKIAFERLDAASATTDVWIVSSDGSGAPVDITNSPGNDEMPAWSPDGTMIAFASDRTGDMEVFVASADGAGTAINLTTDPVAADLEPAWSPDGAAIAFTRRASAEDPAIWVLDIANPSQVTPLSIGAHPAFSPDGARIAFAATVGVGTEIWVMNADGTQPAPLTSLSLENSYPAWQPVTPDAHAPIADAGADQTVECSSFAGGVARLDGSASSDLDSAAGTNDSVRLYEWWEDFGTAKETFLGLGSSLDLTLQLGPHLLTLQVTDSVGQMSTDQVLVTIADTTPPAISVEVSPEVIWPPNHRLVPVHASVVASDICSAVTVALASLTSSEPDSGPGYGHTVNDIQGAGIGTADFDFLVRAERAGRGEGRLYTAVYSATDGSGNTASVSGVVSVPHDHGNHHGNGSHDGGGDGSGGSGQGNHNGQGDGGGHGRGQGNGNGQSHGNNGHH